MRQIVPGSAASRGRQGGSLAPIRERDEHIHSADLSKSKSRIQAGIAKNQAAGYSGTEERKAEQPNKRPPLGHHVNKSSVDVRRPPQHVVGKENIALPAIKGARGISENKF